MRLAPATQADLAHLASVHRRAYSDAHFTSRFPHDLLERYYGHFLGSDCFITKAVPSEDPADAPVGFVVSGLRIGARIAVFKQNCRGAIVRTVLSHPAAAARKIVSDIYFRFLDAPHAFEECPYLILSIASDRSLPGIGAALLESARASASKIGCDAVGLYVRVSNINAIRFYLAHGFLVKGYVAGQFYLETSTS